ncbi:HupE / UreJ protein [Arthrobacter sp. 9AX]|uniref:HupE/UreJ family protein n=1 Tax=Arthrobacter sp. 9AX TaxID=2653131 RepID=UPI0012F0474D|nr:HupE/UreJ family protein [Arthrobacter sp. 9AX]VXB03557.1 HupE / UreJ protein [Arthrobacter sp. 9AX]
MPPAPALAVAPKPRAAVVRSLLAALLIVLAALSFGAAPASAHVLPSSSVQLNVREEAIDAVVKIPVDDLEDASGIDLGDGKAEAVIAHEQEITSYLLAHFAPSSDAGQAWSVTVGDLRVTDAGSISTTGIYEELGTTFTLTPPAGSDARSFNLGYDVVVDQVVTHVVLVSVASDWPGGVVNGSYQVGTIRLDTASGAVQSLHVDLGGASTANGFISMVNLGIQHIQEGTDHQLFLLTLLLPAPLLVVRRGWAGPAPAKKAVRRIAGITLAFTAGHSLTLALGTLGVPVAAAPVEALIAFSILVAAVHAVRPLFAGKEAIVAGFFGLIHGLAFSETLRELDLTGTRLGLSLLGFNLGVEIMQLAVVALVLPPLIVFAKLGAYRGLRVVAGFLAGVAAVGWLVARLGYPNILATAADTLGTAPIPVLAGLWIVVGFLVVVRRRQQPRCPNSDTRPTIQPVAPGTMNG